MPNWAKINLLHRGVRASLGSSGPVAPTAGNIEDYVVDHEYGFMGVGSSSLRGISVNPDLDVIITADTIYNLVRNLDLSVAGDLTSQSAGTTRPEQTTNPADTFIPPNGLKFYQTNFSSLLAADIGTSWDASTIGTITTYALGLGNVVQGVTWSTDGTKCFLSINLTGGKIYEYLCATPFDFSTRASPVILDMNPDGISSPSGLDFDGSGTKLFVSRVFAGAKTIYQYTLSTAWDVSSAAYHGSKVFTMTGGTEYLHLDRVTDSAIYTMRQNSRAAAKLVIS